MKEEFILPKYWYAEITGNNIELIKKWRKDKYNLIDSIDNCYCIISDGSTGFVGGRWLFLKEEELLEYVLKEYVESTSTNDDASCLIILLNKLNIK